MHAAVLQAQIKITNMIRPRIRAEIGQHKYRCPSGNDTPDPPPDPPGEMGNKKKSKGVLKYSWGNALHKAAVAITSTSPTAAQPHPTPSAVAQALPGIPIGILKSKKVDLGTKSN